MYRLKTEHSFDSAHFIANYEGKCANIHGHRWRVEVEIQAKNLVKGGQLDGMVVDFGDLKKDVKEIADFYDHALIIEKGTMRQETLTCLLKDGFRVLTLDFRPTAENFAAHFFQEIKGKGYSVRQVTVFETPNNSATYDEAEGTN